MFIQTEETPNPATLKFIPGETVLDEGTRDFRSVEDAEISPLAARIFAVDGVTGVFLGQGFITVTKDEIDWPQIKPAVLGAIMEHYMSGTPVLSGDGGSETSGEFFDEADSETGKGTVETHDTEGEGCPPSEPEGQPDHAVARRCYQRG